MDRPNPVPVSSIALAFFGSKEFLEEMGQCILEDFKKKRGSTHRNSRVEPLHLEQPPVLNADR